MPAGSYIRVTTPDGQVREFTVDFETAIIGRADGNRIVVPHVSISRRHAHLFFSDGILMLEDFSSATGTFLESQKLKPGEPVAVPPGATFRMGDAVAVYVVESDVAIEPTITELESPVSYEVESQDETDESDSLEAGQPQEPATAAYEPEPEVVEPVRVQAPTPAPPPPVSRPSAQASALAAQSEAVQRQWLGLSLVSPAVAVAPGGTIAATVTVQNRGQEADEASIWVEDIPTEWVEIPRSRISLLPSARSEVTVVFHLPAGSAATAGSHQFTVVARSQEHGIEVRSLGSFNVTNFERLDVAMHPIRSKSKFTVSVANNGNVAAPILIQGADDEGLLNYEMPEETMVLPGDSASIPVTVKARKKKRFGQEQTTPFKLLVRSANSVQPATRLNGTHAYRPSLQPWKAPFAILLLMLGLGSGTYGVVNLCRRDTGICADLTGRGKEKAPDTVPAAADETANVASTATVEPSATVVLNCGSVRLKTGSEAVVINSGKTDLNVHADGTLASAVTDRVGDNLRVKLGECKIDSTAGTPLIFWQVTYNGKSGWIAEYDPPTKVFLLSPVS